MMIFHWFYKVLGRLESKMLIFHWLYNENAFAGAAQVQAAGNARDPPVDTVEPFFTSTRTLHRTAVREKP